MNYDFLKRAISIAELSSKDVPVGAVIVRNNEIIAEAVNEREKQQNAIYHAEIIAIKKACEKLGTWRLNDCDMYVTLEPCPMCAGAIVQARIRNLYFGAYDVLNGAFGSKINIKMIMNSDILVKGGLLEEDCVNILKNYFEGLRKC